MRRSATRLPGDTASRVIFTKPVPHLNQNVRFEGKSSRGELAARLTACNPKAAARSRGIQSDPKLTFSPAQEPIEGTGLAVIRRSGARGFNPAAE